MTSSATLATSGRVMNWGWPYDAVVWLSDKTVFRGKLAEARRRAIELADLAPGEAVLDVGCGTGTLALLAKEQVGTAGRVVGVDPGPRQIARARAKTRGRGIELEVGVIEKLPFADGTFDAVLSTLMMHHLPDELKRRGLAEVARVLTPGGRLVVIDVKRHAFAPGKPPRVGAGGFGVAELPILMAQAGFIAISSGDLPMPRLPGLPRAGYATGRLPYVAAAFTAPLP